MHVRRTTHSTWQLAVALLAGALAGCETAASGASPVPAGAADPAGSAGAAGADAYGDDLIQKAAFAGPLNVVIHMPCEDSAGTDAKAKISLVEHLLFVDKINTFSLDNGSIPACRIVNFGPKVSVVAGQRVHAIKLRHDNTGFSPNWKVTDVQLSNSSGTLVYYCPVNAWITTGNNPSVSYSCTCTGSACP